MPKRTSLLRVQFRRFSSLREPTDCTAIGTSDDFAKLLRSVARYTNTSIGHAT
jgi:hypothetical protein